MSRFLAVGIMTLLVVADPVAAQDLDTVGGPRGIGPDAHGLVRVDPPARVLSRTEGSVSIPIVLGLFSGSAEPHISREQIQASLFDGPSARGTVTDAYLEMSRGKINVGGDVFPWVRTDVPLDSAVGTTNGVGGDARADEYFLQALAAADAVTDFGQYDNDGPDGLPDSGDDDGYVDIIAFEFLEVGASCGEGAIWPHKWSLSGWGVGPFETSDSSAQDSVSVIKVDEYITQSVADCSGNIVQDASVIAHEFGHVLGLPDFYHPTVSGAGATGRRWVLGCWALMAAGGWGCGPLGENRGQFGPTHLSAHAKSQLGWLTYTDVGEGRNQEFVLEPVRTSGDALRIPLDATGDEFLILEYRDRMGFDAELPAAGVLIYKQDLQGRLRPDTASTDPYFLRLLERDDNDGLIRNSFEGGNRGEAGDAWGVGGVTDELHAGTSPRLALSGGQATSVTLHEVAVEGGQARVVVSNASTPEILAPADPLEVPRVESFSEVLRIAGGAMPYWFAAPLPEGVSAHVDGDDLILEGSFTTAGGVQLTLVVGDAHGNLSPDMPVALSVVGEWVVTLDELLQPLLQSDALPLSRGEADYLDSLGNANGRYDVGDLRRWLREGG